MIRYGQLGMDKRLRDIVFAGSHDAGITKGGKNAKTQDKNIYNQALCGIRFFDVRVRAGKVGTGKNKPVQLMAYHANDKKAFHLIKDTTSTRTLAGKGEQRNGVVVSHLRSGVFGLDLKSMLRDAARFVQIYDTEFLIFKFDKCTNWPLIAEYCTDFLGAKIFDGTGNLARKTLQDLRGRVVVLFSKEGYDAVKHHYPPGSGILQWRNLHSKDKESGLSVSSYKANFNGLQYFGKGGTPLGSGAFKGYEGKTGLNIDKETKHLNALSAGNTMANSSNVLGMMYWTSTGILESIKKRDDFMWHPDNNGLTGLWTAGLQDAIDQRLKANRIKLTHYQSGPQMKTAMPNIIMIDFADERKCKTIYDLNRIAATKLTEMAKSSERQQRLHTLGQA